MIPSNVPLLTGREFDYIREAVEMNKHLCGDGLFTKKCSEWIERKFAVKKALLTTSCTHALEMAAILINTQAGDEIIMPSYTFVSTANAFVLRGAKIVFVDIRPDTMNIDEKLIEEAITSKTRAIVPVHYAGIACEMDSIMALAKKYKLWVIEDAAQGVMAFYKGNALGSIGDFGCYSFHSTKNYTMGEGGALLVNREEFIEYAEIVREKGTDRSKFLRNQIDKYTWRNIGSSYLPSEINAAYLWAQLEKSEEINIERKRIFDEYKKGLSYLAEIGKITLPSIPLGCEHNAHMFYIKTRTSEECTRLIEYLSKNDVRALSHYVPLHTSPAGIKYSRFHGTDIYTTEESHKLIRLPMWYGLRDLDILHIVTIISEFYKKI